MLSNVISLVALLATSDGSSELTCREWITIMERGQEYAHVYTPCVSEAQAGDPEIEYFVGISHLFSGNEDEAMKLLISSAKKGYAPSHFALSEIYKKRDNLEKSEYHVSQCLSLGLPSKCGK